MGYDAKACGINTSEHLYGGKTNQITLRFLFCVSYIRLTMIISPINIIIIVHCHFEVCSLKKRAS